MAAQFVVFVLEQSFNMHGVVESVLHILVRHWFSLSSVAIAAWLWKNRYNKGLNKYPGPFLASLTDWWRFFDVLGRRPERTHIELHRRHGDVVRLGPNTLSFADPKALKTIYGLNKGFTKVSMDRELSLPAAMSSILGDIRPTDAGRTSPTSTLFSRALSRATVSRRSSARPTTISTRSYGAASTAPSPCLLCCNMSPSSIA